MLIISLTLIITTACNNDDDEELQGNWSELSDFDGVPRSDAVGFAINDKGYIGTGYDGDDRLNDFWEYSVSGNYWTQKADFPGEARNGAVGISIGEKGYIGTGYNGEDKLNDFWEYDPSTNTWEQKADYMGSARYGAVGFSIDNKGYIGTGYDGNYLKDFYAYTPESNSWEKIISIDGSKRRDAAAFVINGIGYVVSGIDNGSYEYDFCAYDPSTGKWTEKRDISNVTDDDYDNDYTSIVRINGVGLSFNGKGYLVSGSTSSVNTNVWEYDPVTDLWEERTSFEGTARTEAVGFGIGSFGYISTGRSSSYYFDDIWRLDPTAEYDEYN
ncbi:MAG: galactose oxidase [Prolixibacteraceae bacterium]|nr:galactose oxidase [Prolixibacteraceae bacterium]